MSTDSKEYGVPVIFDVAAHSREEAGCALVQMLAGHNLPGTTPNNVDRSAPRIESWWTLEAIDKAHDRNDNEAGVVIFDKDLDYLLRLLNETWAKLPGLDVERHDRLKRYLTERVGWDDTEGATT